MSTATTTSARTTLAYDERGTGTPIVFVHGLTFDRRVWAPIVERLADEFRCITIDLPGHGESAGPPPLLSDVADDLHNLLGAIGVDRPVVVGHSMGAMVALVYAAMYDVAGVVDVDQPLDVRPFVALIHRLEPALRGERFMEAFEPFWRSIGVADLPEPERTRVGQTCRLEQSLVLGYWDEAMKSSSETLQHKTDDAARGLRVPWLGIFGRGLDREERRRLVGLIPHAEVEEWPGGGHVVHLVEPERFATRLRAFARHCVDPLRPYDADLVSNRALLMGILDRCVNRNDLAALRLYTDNPRVVASITSIVTGFPDARVLVEWATAEGDIVAAWHSFEGTHLGPWRGFAPTGRRTLVRGSLAAKIVGGKIVDFWLCADWLRMYRHLGLSLT